MKFKKTCCAFSKSQLEYHCEQHGDKCPDQVIRFEKAYKEYGLNFPDRFLLIAKNANYEATYCPSCGKKLKETCIPEMG